MDSESRVKPAYYFSLPDHEILDDDILQTLSCDEDTWLYTPEAAGINEKFEHLQLDPSFQHKHIQSTSGSMDSRTFTRRKHCSVRPSLETVMDSPLSNNRSSLGLLSSSKLLNNSLTQFTPVTIQTSESQGKIFSNSTVSEKKPVTHRVFKLDSPFTNSGMLEGMGQYPFHNAPFERKRINSESSDTSVPYSLENCSYFDKNGVMTDSMVNFLENQEVSCRPPTAFQDDDGMTDSLVRLSEGEMKGMRGYSEPMTESLVNFLAPVNCKPPSGFEDTDMTGSVVNVYEADDLPGCDMSNSVINYLENVRPNPSAPVIESTASCETENVPPNNLNICDRQLTGTNSNCLGRVKPSGDSRTNETAKQNSTFEVKNSEVDTSILNNGSDKIADLTFTNNVNLTRTRIDKEDVGKNFGKEYNSTLRDNGEQNLKFKALNNRDLNVTHVLNCDEIMDINVTKTLIKEVPSKGISPKRNGTFTKSELVNETINLSNEIPIRKSFFNTTFTKLPTPNKLAKSSEGLNGGMDDDQTSSASDSSFSSGSTKPRSVDELRSIAQQQESSLVQQTSTPTESSAVSSNLAKLDLELSPIRRLSIGSSRNGSESRSANSSPVRSLHQQPHPISKLQQPVLEARRQTLQASSLSNISRPKVSGLRMPQAMSVIASSQSSVVRPISGPAFPRPSTGIPRPQASRLPMPSFRRSGIPGPKRGAFH